MRFQTLAAAVAVFLALPAFAEEGVHINDPYARSMGGIGASGAVFLVIENHAAVEDRLLDVASDVAEMVELHTHVEDANGVMQMKHVTEGLLVEAGGSLGLARGGAHVMLMGLKRDLKDGDIIHLTLTFEQAGVVELDVPIDNAR